MTRPIKFRGREFFSKRFVYGQTIRETSDGFDIWSGDEWIHCTDLAQLIGYDCDGREVYEGDTLVNEHGEEFTATLVPAVITEEGFLHSDIDIAWLKLKEATS